MNIFKMKILRRAERSQKNMVYVSPEDFHDLVKARELNMDGVMVSKNVIVKVDRDCPVGLIR